MAGGYPRDLRGNGRTPPHPHWPGDARVAGLFAAYFEEGGENNILHGDPASEAILSDVLGAQPWPGQRHANVEPTSKTARPPVSGSCGESLASATSVFHVWRPTAADRLAFLSGR